MRRRPRSRRDHYSRKARSQSFPARSVFKLEEIDRKHSIIRPGDAVLDLGCAPGSWLLYASKRVGPKGLVLGVDLHRLGTDLPENARFLKADVADLSGEEISSKGADRFDVVLSDMAPHTTGNRFVDQQRSLRLILGALDLAEAFGRPGAALVGKVFHGEDVGDAVARAEALFEWVRLVKPKAVRKGSYEIYVVARGQRGATPAEHHEP